MTNRERINAMTDQEMAEALCKMVGDVIEAVTEKANVDFDCKYCPAEKLCKKGCNGFIAFLASPENPENTETVQKR